MALNFLPGKAKINVVLQMFIISMQIQLDRFSLILQIFLFHLTSGFFP